MIKAEELRVGNWVNLSGRLTPINYIYIGDLNRPMAVGIPLTPEILEGCGFEKYHDNSDNAFYLGDIELYKVGDVYNTEHYVTKTKYLHQLQNLYFALTGEELTVKLPVTA